VGVVGRRFVNFGVRWGGGYRYQITVCVCRIAGVVVGRLCAVEGWVCGCCGGMENIFLLA
jgi:hypothetical protein